MPGVPQLGPPTPGGSTPPQGTRRPYEGDQGHQGHPYDRGAAYEEGGEHAHEGDYAARAAQDEATMMAHEERGGRTSPQLEAQVHATEGLLAPTAAELSGDITSAILPMFQEFERKILAGINERVQAMIDHRCKEAYAQARRDAAMDAGKEIYEGRLYNPGDKHLLKSYALYDQQENSKELFLYGFERNATAADRHSDAAGLFQDYASISDHDLKSVDYETEHPGHNVYNAAERMSSYKIRFKSVGARKKAQAHINRKNGTIRCRARNPTHQEVVDQLLLTMRNGSALRDLRIDYREKLVYSQSEGNKIYQWDWNRCCVLDWTSCDQNGNPHRVYCFENDNAMGHRS